MYGKIYKIFIYIYVKVFKIIERESNVSKFNLI